MADKTDEPVERVIVVVDLSRYTNIAMDLDRQVGGKGVALLNRQIQDMVDSALTTIEIVPESIPSKFTGDGKILAFETAEKACEFAESLHLTAEKHNKDRNTLLHRRHFRIGCCFGKIVIQPITSANGEVVGHDFAGVAVSTATRLEGACKTGEILICSETWAYLPSQKKLSFGMQEKVEGKHKDEHFLVHRRKVVAPSPTTESVTESDLLLEILSKAIASDTAPRAQGDIGEAIRVAISSVDLVVEEASNARRHITLHDIGNITGEAIHHGAGIYNAKSYLGCATIYLHAARRTLECMPDIAPTEHGPPKKGTMLAAEWLARIVIDNPTVDESTADDLAWELRFAFDSIHQIPLFDQISTAIATARSVTGKPDAVGARTLVRNVLTICEGIRDVHITAYLLRHTAYAVLSLIDQGGAAAVQGMLANWYQALRPVVDANPRITRYNTKQLADGLSDIFRVEDNGSTRRTGLGPWYNPRTWFGNN